MPLSPEAKKLRARIAARRRWSPDSDTADAQRELRVLIAEDYLRELVAAGLSDSQRVRLAALLHPAAAEGPCEQREQL